LADKVDVKTVPVDPNGPRGKVYKIVINDESYFEVNKPANGPPDIVKRPHAGWKTPINFKTFTGLFGPGKGEPGGEAKDKMYEELKAAIVAKA